MLSEVKVLFADLFIQEVEEKDRAADDTLYYQIQGAFEGTPAQVGPPVDLSITILGMKELENGRYTCTLLEGFTKSEFYNFQVSGAADMCLKTYGEVPLPQEHKAKKAVKKAFKHWPKRLQIFGGILRDETGLGKTKQTLLMLALYAKYGKVTHDLPILIIVSATLIKQWAKEIREMWPGFTLWFCYASDDLLAVQMPNVITTSHLKSLPNLSNLPLHMRRLFDKSSGKGINIVLSSYETWSERTVWQEVVTSVNQKGETLKHKEHRSRVTGLFGHVIIDEGHRAKNRETRIHASILLLAAIYCWVITATPMQNSEMVSSSKSTFHLGH